MVTDLRHCRHGHQVPDAASLCPTCGDGSSVGDPVPGLGGAASGWVWVVVGLVVTAVGRLMWTGAVPRETGQAFLGAMLFVLGIVLLGIGVVAQGVIVGMRRWQHESGERAR